MSVKKTVIPMWTSMPDTVLRCNVHFKSPTDDYVKMFEQMDCRTMIISTRGLKAGCRQIWRVGVSM